MTLNLSMRDIVREIAAQAVEEYFGGSEWLNNNDNFDHSLKLTDDDANIKVAVLLNQLLPKQNAYRKMNQKLTDTNILCANLLLNATYKPIAISLARKDYNGRNRYIKASTFTIQLVHILNDAGFIDLQLGYHTKDEARMSRIWPTTKLVNYFTPPPPIDYTPLELVVLRNQVEKENIDIAYIDTPETINIRNILRKANSINRIADVRIRIHHSFEQLSTDLHAVFSNNSFDEGGRLYTGRWGYQSRSNKDRKNITINGHRTIELDYSGFHPRLLYALEGIQFNDDPYYCFDDELRPFTKRLLLALLNAKSIGKAVNCGYKERYDDYELYKTLRDLKTNPKEMIEVFCKAHLPIAKYFGQNIGMKLMRIDSKIALGVVEHFTSRDIPILAVHDSFIVQDHLEAELKKVMQDNYKKYSGGFGCPIK